MTSHVTRVALALAHCMVILCIGSAEVRAQAPVQLYVFDCGRLHFENLELFGISNDETDVRELAVPCYVVEHERGRLLWEGGLPSRVADSAGWQGEGMRMRLDRTLADQLAEMDLAMDDFDYVAFSHMHFDHAGAANEVEGATHLIQRAEYETAFADSATAVSFGFDPWLWEDLRDARTTVLEGTHDVFGDGRVRLLPAPGHTPGHQVLFLDLVETGPIVLSGDLYHFRLSRQDGRVPTVNFDREQTLRSMERIEAFIDEVGAELWIEHDLARFRKLRKAPSFYQ